MINFKFAGPHVEGLRLPGSERAGAGRLRASTLSCRFDASGAAYGATATTRATFHFAAPRRPLSYSLAGTFQNLDMRRLPERLSMPKLETQAAGRYQFEATRPRLAGRRGSERLDRSKARVSEPAHSSAIESRNRALSYSAQRQRGLAQSPPVRRAARNQVARRRPVQRIADRNVHVRRQRAQYGRAGTEDQRVAGRFDAGGRPISDRSRRLSDGQPRDAREVRRARSKIFLERCLPIERSSRTRRSTDRPT